jgi:hypothetical protein
MACSVAASLERAVTRVGLAFVLRALGGFFGQYPSSPRGPYLHGGLAFGAFFFGFVAGAAAAGDFFFAAFFFGFFFVTGAPPGIACRAGFFFFAPAVPRATQPAFRS